MKKLNKKIGNILGTGAILSVGILIRRIAGRKTQNISELADRDFDFAKTKGKESALPKEDFGTKDKEENFLELEDDLDLFMDEYLKEEIKTEEEKQEEFREVSIKALDVLLKEVLSISETLSQIEMEVKKQGKYKEPAEELEKVKEEIISLWEHIEALSNNKEKDRG
ncbi:hypothetical protein SAMN02745784_00913 [Tissierella praeacuta DSM 18095]|uniref:Uncharacterized protein n=1 Tax=Tissierella praeacuta DSM 18095 TaxID=1123404 RepID=A0A1M4TXX5_9FIRM|nr:hypothetical protein [Tissierella praeacuta]SHE49305.1 hypothetical protein SAMN02745784_00913 [Tissierella praeacuta DSM 18095]SUP04185.1 Uncharacterised protein [Tissierella praeacuta]